mmetsp:Transcript_29985/g.60245  ORF Transcript_29985/g.60245 Transcript_29985/m.60245 type:complete len:290 (+) Transcript_29985:124-993(+)|eukprot:CAMPEP_0113397806 /NCGR_PEP_ID=MMETSP0013_2-20120614/14593_1 /TAXON_ID=2843 ORGANISM="Skeletonema costatum, Strain 1716" /NCGR_SAMPLE_ID=MMETSP0013_2 /ASSEMBLY_ACC=CAM_ASM_000158 /LENGTH=289 /DNA_ID=CAMNT_0000282447 /DNA_START=109 /DNA_END=978 /DNA_ORIENTATION=+ /assembly_acc=CAM_ASM_000158
MWVRTIVVVTLWHFGTLAFATTTQSTNEINAIIVGGSSGMGKAAAVQTVKNGGNVLLVSRSADKLQQAKEQIETACGGNIGRVKTRALDATDEAAVQAFANELSSEDWEFHALIVSAAGRAPHGPMTDLPTADTRSMMETKFWTAYNAAKYINPKLKEGGSITFVSGVLGRRPGINCCPLAVTNGALEGLTRSLALELGPRLRVNCLSPGFCDTERFDRMDTDRKAAMLANTADSLPLRRVGESSDMGEAIHYLATAKFVTGVVLDVDGGHSIRQYANSNSDPMRKQSD